MIYDKLQGSATTKGKIFGRWLQLDDGSTCKQTKPQPPIN